MIVVDTNVMVHFVFGDSAYDAEFVVLARMLAVPLATLDREIFRGAADVAVLPGDER